MSYQTILLQIIESMVEDDDETKQLLKKIEIAYREKMELERQVKGKSAERKWRRISQFNAFLGVEIKFNMFKFNSYA